VILGGRLWHLLVHPLAAAAVQQLVMPVAPVMTAAIPPIVTAQMTPIAAIAAVTPIVMITTMADLPDVPVTELGKVSGGRYMTPRCQSRLHRSGWVRCGRTTPPSKEYGRRQGQRQKQP